jgi:hypothetical protein
MTQSLQRTCWFVAEYAGAADALWRGGSDARPNTPRPWGFSVRESVRKEVEERLWTFLGV